MLWQLTKEELSNPVVVHCVNGVPLQGKLELLTQNYEHSQLAIVHSQQQKAAQPGPHISNTLQKSRVLKYLSSMLVQSLPSMSFRTTVSKE